MREFVSAVEDAAAVDEREAKIIALVEAGKTREEAEAEVDEGDYAEFKLDGRTMRAYPPTEGQLIFMLASMGRGQSQESRLASIVNVMLESLREEDKDYFEGRLLSRRKEDQIPPSVIEKIFEGLTEEWFGNAHPTQPASDSAR